MCIRDSTNNSTRRILVTGSSSGIGQALAIRIARDGFPVTVHYGTNRTGAETTIATIRAQGGTAGILCFDIADREAARAALTADIAQSGPFWGVVLNAGIARDFAFPSLEADDWDTVLTTNLDSFHHVLHPLIMPMIRQRNGGRIISIASVSGLTGNRGQVNYSASKAGLIGATKALAVELATRGITANTVVPGIIETAMTENLPTDEALKMIPMQRFGKPEEVAGIVAFLLGEEAGYITRQTISVNGGMV